MSKTKYFIVIFSLPFMFIGAILAFVFNAMLSGGRWYCEVLEREKTND